MYYLGSLYVSCFTFWQFLKKLLRKGFNFILIVGHDLDPGVHIQAVTAKKNRDEIF